jgi:general secretion pathway protein N
MGLVRAALIFVAAAVCWQGLCAQTLAFAETPSALPWLKLESLSATRERPLFTPSRRRAELSLATQLPSPSVALEEREKDPEIELTGLIEENNITMIFLRTRSQTVIVRSGDKFGRWQVKAISKISVQLTDGTKQIRLEMFAKR